MGCQGFSCTKHLASISTAAATALAFMTCHRNRRASLHDSHRAHSEDPAAIAALYKGDGEGLDPQREQTAASEGPGLPWQYGQPSPRQFMHISWKIGPEHIWHIHLEQLKCMASRCTPVRALDVHFSAATCHFRASNQRSEAGRLCGSWPPDSQLCVLLVCLAETVWHRASSGRGASGALVLLLGHLRHLSTSENIRNQWISKDSSGPP